MPCEFKYEVIPAVKKQFQIVKELLNRPDVETIYVCTDSGREGEYIYRLVAQMAGVHNKTQKRVWIDSQTEEEILRGVQKQKTFLNMIIFLRQHIFGQKKIILWELIFPEF